MKKFTVIMSLFLGLAMFSSCKDKNDPVKETEVKTQEDFKLSKNALSLIVGQSESFEIQSGNAPFSLSENEFIEASAEGKTITIKALKCDASALNATPVVLTLTDKAGKKQEVKISIYNKLDIATQDVKLFEGQKADVRINAGKLDAFKLTVKDENIATAKIASEMIGKVELKKILVTTKAKGETELTVTDGLTTQTVKIIVKEIKPITLWGAVEGELKEVKDYTIKAGENYSFTIKGGAGAYKLDYDKTKLSVSEVEEHGDNYVVKVTVKAELKKSEDLKFKVLQEGNDKNFAELTIKAVVPKKAFGATYEKGGKAYKPTAKNSDNEDILEAAIGQELVINLEGGSGDYYMQLSDGEKLLELGATGLVKGKRQYGSTEYDFYLIPDGKITIKAKKTFKQNMAFFAVLDKGSFISREKIYFDIVIK